MDFQDFPRILGNLGVETDHPPKMCARHAKAYWNPKQWRADRGEVEIFGELFNAGYRTYLFSLLVPYA